MLKLKTFKKILRKSQEELKETLTNFIKAKGYKPVIGDGFLYAMGDIPILLVAHMDTVHRSKPTEIYCDEEQKVIWSPQGIGGDDRCGVYIIMRLLEAGYKPYVLFLEDEEIGCVGAKKCTKVLKAPKVKFIIEVDRRGSDDCVFYDCFNPDFTKYIESFGFEYATGTYSDICELSFDWGIASVNLSAGYYNEHTFYEYIKLDDMEKTFNRITEILKDDEFNFTYFEYDEIGFNSKNNLNSLKDLDDEDYYLKSTEEYGYLDDHGKWHWYEDERKAS